MDEEEKKIKLEVLEARLQELQQKLNDLQKKIEESHLREKDKNLLLRSISRKKERLAEIKNKLKDAYSLDVREKELSEVEEILSGIEKELKRKTGIRATIVRKLEDFFKAKNASSAKEGKPPEQKPKEEEVATPEEISGAGKEWLKKSMKKEWLTKEREEWENKIKSCEDLHSLAQIEKELEEKMQKEGGLPGNDYWIYHGTPTYPGLKKLIEERKEFLKKLAEEEAGKMYERMYKEKDKPTKAVKDWMKGAKWWKRKERIEKTEKRFGNIIWKAEKAFGMGEIEEEGKRIQKGKLRFALGFVGFVVSIILYLATEAWLLVLPVGITSVYLLITARGSAIDFFEDHPLFIVSLILSTIGFILASWPGLLAGPIFFGLSKAIPKEEIRSAVGKIMLYILLVVAFILFLPKVLEYTHITMSLPLIAIAGVINGIILGYVWTAAETESKEEWEKKLIIEQLKKIKMEEREMKEKSEDRKKREEEEKGEEE